MTTLSEWMKTKGAAGSDANRKRVLDNPDLCAWHPRQQAQSADYLASRQRLILAARDRVAKELDQAERWIAQIHVNRCDDLEYFIRDARELLYRMQAIGSKQR